MKTIAESPSVRSVEQPPTTAGSRPGPVGCSADHSAQPDGPQKSRIDAFGKPNHLAGSSTDPTPQATWSRVVKWLASLLIGLLIGVLLHYFLYRISLPVQPFIYLVF